MKNKFLNFLSFLLGAAIVFGVAKMLWNLQDYTYVTHKKRDFCVDPERPAMLIFNKYSSCKREKLFPKIFRDDWTWSDVIYIFSPEEEREISEILRKDFCKSFWWRKSDCGYRATPPLFILNLKIPLYEKIVGFSKDAYPRANIPENDRQKLQGIIGKIIEKIQSGDVPAGTRKVFGNAIFDDFFGWKFENEIHGNAENSVLAGTHFVVDFDLLNRVKTVQKFDGNAKIWERNYVYKDLYWSSENFNALESIRFVDAEKTLMKAN